MGKQASLKMNLLRRMNIGDLAKRTASKYPGRTAFVFKEHRISFKELNEQCCSFAHYFEEAGICKGDRVAFMTHNCLHYIYAWLGLAKIGGIINPLNFMLKGHEVETIVNDSEPKMFFIEDALIPQVGDSVKKMKSVETFGYIPIWGNAKPDGWVNINDYMKPNRCSEEPEVEIDDDEPASLIYTSGTESLPKGVMNTHKNFFMTIMSGMADLDVNSEDTLILSIPLFHVAAKFLFLEALSIGATVVLEYSPNPVEILELTQKEKITYWVYPPALYQFIAAMPNYASFDITSLKKCISFGAMMPPVLHEKWKSIAPGIEWRNYYGMTESSPLGSTLMPKDFERKINTIGIPHSGIEIKIADDQDQELPAGETGEILMRGPSIMKGYFRNEEKTAETLRNGWLHTGDIGRFDDEGFLYFIDRKKDIIKTGGENVSSQEVEGILYKHDKVAQVAVIGLSDAYWGEVVSAVIVPKPGTSVTSDEIISFSKANLAAYKVPKKVIVIEKMPMSPTGKILKRLLKEEFGKEEMAGSVN